MKGLPQAHFPSLLHLSHVPALQVKSGQCSTLNLVEVSSGLQLSLSGHVRPYLIHLLSRQFEHHWHVWNKTYYYIDAHKILVRFMVFNATFNNISVLLLEETGVSRENHRPATRHLQTSMLYLVQLAWTGFQLVPLVSLKIDKCFTHQVVIKSSCLIMFYFLHF